MNAYDINDTCAVRVMDAMRTAYWRDEDERNPFAPGTQEHRMFQVWYPIYSNRIECEVSDGPDDF